jgi:hypothetical protein
MYTYVKQEHHIYIPRTHVTDKSKLTRVGYETRYALRASTRDDDSTTHG